ncbi:hypothetical protein [uncultured Sphaerochaeta sp.]|uniref:hypothetical protein n=1 Tax=uncultured Sphaerochaeta sp. TaxID=886478 RepID=UPI0029C9B52D|nr:hypothetical protein [uncultured Sphaerochaeta sp.]
MDNLLGTLIYKITGDSTALDKNLESSRSKIEKTGISIEKMGDRIKRVSTTIISGYLIKSLLNASSRVEELQNKFDTVFAGIENDTNAWVRQYADATNRGITATKEFLATQQDLRTGYGDTIESAARYSQAVVGITNDLASFSNVPVAEAMAAMQSGLSFQFEALRRLGVSLSVATINQGEYAKAIGKTWEQMSNLEKQEAVLSGVVSQSKNALHQDVQLWKEYNYTVGDAARTSDSFANSSQGAQQRLDDLKAELGDALIPTATAFLNLGLDIMQMFNDWPDAAQSATAAALAFGVAMTTITGPVGIAIGSIAALTVLISSAKGPSEQLAEATDKLAEASYDYSQITKQLTSDTENMSQAERTLLEIRQQAVAAEAYTALAEVAKKYKSTSDEIEIALEEMLFAQAQMDAYKIGKKGKSFVDEMLENLGDKDQLSNYEQTLRKTLSVLASDWEEISGRLDKNLENAANTFKDRQEVYETGNAELSEALAATAQLYRDGLIDIESYKYSDKELYDLIVNLASAMTAKTDATEADTEATKQAIFVANDWQTKLKELKADQAEEAGNFKDAASIRISLLKAEREEAIRKLASDANLINSEEDVTALSIDELTKRIMANAGAWDELKALNAAFILETQQINKEADEQLLEADQEKADALAENAREVADMLSEQAAASKKAAASEWEQKGEYEKAYALRLGLLNKERDTALAAMQEKVDKGEATEQELRDLRIYYRNEAIDIELEKNKAIEEADKKKAETLAENAKKILEADKKKADILAKNAKKVTDMLSEQAATSKKTAASEWEQKGEYEKAYALRLGLLNKERDTALAAMQEKVDKGEATEQELRDLRIYYRNEAIDIELEKNKAIEEADKKKTDTLAENAKKISDMLLSQSTSSKESTATELEQIGKFRDAGAIRLALIEQERDAAIAAMQEKVDKGEATQKELDDLGIYYANKQVQLQKDQAEKTKDFWLDVVSTVSGTISNLSSEFSAFLSSQTDARIDAIDKQTETQLAALGLQEKSAIEKLQDEYDAAVEAGDMELAQEKSRAIEKQRIEDEADKKKQQLQIEQAKREKELNIFTATISMLSAIVKALADPGGWAGVGLSVAAGVTGALQIAAIQSQPLPSFAVGAENIPEDMLAVVHQGETILPAPMAESVRKGDATYGQGSNVKITINNYSGAAVTQEERETDQGREYLISIGKAVDKQISEGRYDRSLGNRYGVKKVGIHG